VTRWIGAPSAEVDDRPREPTAGPRPSTSGRPPVGSKLGTTGWCTRLWISFPSARPGIF